MSIMNEIYKRYVSPEMEYIFSKENKYGKWRLVWLALAESQCEAGFPINRTKLDKVKQTADLINFDRIAEIESENHHDVMAHLIYWAEICPEVNETIHLGATSSYVTDNSECILQKEALSLIIEKIKRLYNSLYDQASKSTHIPVIGYTHFQPASPTTIGKRITLWMQDLLSDYNNIVDIYNNMLCRGAKGATGTQASYLELVDGNYQKIKLMDKLIAEKLKFKSTIELSGQTITRKQDVKIADTLSQLSITLYKIGNDIRLLSHTGDLREGFRKHQIGSSAMPYKKNPILSERLCGLSRMVPNYRNMLTQTAMVQWLERSLDDSCLRRIAIPEMFMIVDGALNTAQKLIPSLHFKPMLDIGDNIYLLSEILLSKAIKNHHNRQEVHKKLQNYTLKAQKSNNPKQTFINLVSNDNIWSNDSMIKNLDKIKLVNLIGLAAEQSANFLKNHPSF